MVFRRPQPTTRDEQLRVERFALAVRAATPRTWVVRALVAANVAVWIVQVIGGLDAFQPTAAELIGWGANFGPQTLGGEPWRLFTSMFLHGGLLHLAMNMYVLWVIGDLVERLLGNVGFFVTYTLAGLAGSLASVFFQPFVASVGASGAIFGVMGALLGFILRSRDTVPKSMASGILRMGAFFIVINVLFAASVPGIDQAAHMGGLVAGFLCGLALAHPMTREGVSRRFMRNGVVALVGGGAIAAGVAFVPLPQDPNAQLNDTLSEAQRHYVEAAGRYEGQRITAREFADVITDQVLPRWDRVVSQLSESGVSDDDPQMKRLKQARTGYQMLAEGLRRRDTQQQIEALRLLNEGRAPPHP